MSHDARARQGRKISVCYLCSSPDDLRLTLSENFFQARKISPDNVEIWAYVAPDMLKTWAERTPMPISAIPCEAEAERVPLDERMAEPVSVEKTSYTNCDGRETYVLGGEAGRLTPARNLADFDLIVFGHVHFARLSDHDYLQEVAERNPDIIVTGTSGEAVSRERLSKLKAERALLEMMIRNTFPLISMARARVGSPTAGLREIMRVLCAPEIQVLLRLKHAGLTRDQWHRSHVVTTLVVAGLVTDELDACPRVTEIGEGLIRSLHPSAYDPGFIDRWMAWLRDPDAHVDQYRRWIRTWSGRLRRHQARTWKASVPKAAFDAATAEIETRVRVGAIFSRTEAARALAERHPEMGGEAFFFTVITHRMIEVIERGDLVSGITHRKEVIYGLPQDAGPIHLRKFDIAAVLKKGNIRIPA